MVKMEDYAGGTPAWCPGCGNFAILVALRRALVDLDLEPYRVLMVSDIGQAGKLPHYTRGNVLNVLHGRTLPAAIGAKIANPELTVIGVAGDGGSYGEGGNHFLHALRYNHDITHLVHNNQVYALTRGQTSPTSDPGYVTRTTPQGAPTPINPITLAIIGGASWVGRGFAGDINHLVQLITRGIQHKGFALVDILQPCPTFNRKNTFAWYRERVYKLEEDETYDPTDKMMAFSKAVEWGDRIPIGVIYQAERPTFGDYLFPSGAEPLVKQKLDPFSIAPLLEEFV
ncbi:MAG: 2-oxoacid ferredoxin oxidoreductase [Chloroflexi bacterium]|nr:2-oxoacid ferredoxin oxidoreductase [Chloroflexota bacterium]